MKKTILAGSLIVAVVMSVVRWCQTTAVIPAEAAHFTAVHDLKWDAYSQQFSRTGNDPYIIFDLPKNAVPIRSVIFEFEGQNFPGEGSFYIFPSAPGGHATGFGDMVPATVVNLDGNFEVRATLRDSRVLRLDVPDYLGRPLQFRRALIHRRYARLSSGIFLSSIACGAIALGALASMVRDTLRQTPRPLVAPVESQGSQETAGHG